MKSTCCCVGRNYCKINSTIICMNSGCGNYLSETTLSFTQSFTQLVYTLMICSLICFPYNKGKSDSDTKIQMVYFKKSYMPVPELNIENLRNEIKKNNILCPDEVCAQIKLESANLSSFLLKRTNNMLGMRFPYVRPTKAVGIYLPSKDTIIYGSQKELLKYRKELSYAAYASWMDAVQDYKLWQDHSFNVKKRYLDFLSRNYAEDTLYINKIKYISAKNKALIN